MTVRLKTADKKDVRLDNVLCHLNIYSDNDSYYTFSFIPTDSNGTVFLTRNQILANTELKHFYNDSFPLDKSPIKFEFMVLDKDFISSFIKSVDTYLSVDLDSALNELRTRGLTDVQIEKATPAIVQKKEEDLALNSFLKKNNNQTLTYSQDKSKISDRWTEEKDYVYDLILQT
ncbi:MAG: hypothetical protein ACXVPN_03900 [Bacteroidia bacterium]